MAATTGAFHGSIQGYSVNVAVLDEQHRGLIATVNGLVAALSNGEGAVVTDGVLQKPVDYALTHFAAEESLMSEHNFPGLANRKSSTSTSRRKSQSSSTSTAVAGPVFQLRWHSSCRPGSSSTS